MASLNGRVAGPRRSGSERGAEIIELAIVTPLFLLLIAALFDFGFLFRSWEVVTNAAREGARIGVLPEYVCDDATPDVENRVRAYLSASGITNAITVDVNTTPIVNGTDTFDACVVSVALEQPLPTLSVLGTLTGGSFGSVDVRANSVMRTEAQAASAP
jgi:Flp pilus assembly protein TadG